MSRRRAGLVDYVGAAGRITISEAMKLSPREWTVFEKADGIYVHIFLDGSGRIERILSRGGLEVPRGITGDLIGCFVGAPGGTVLVGELEHGSIASVRAVAARGYRVIHVFDCLRLAGEYLAREPYRVRLDAAWRSQSWAENFKPEAPVLADTTGRLHDRRSGRFVERPAPRDWRRCPILPRIAPAQAGDLWERACAGEVEGAVIANLNAPAGRRGSKRKAKPAEFSDLRVLAVARTTIIADFAGTPIALARGRHLGEVAVGDIVEVRHISQPGTRVPRHAGITRVRHDLQGAQP